MPQVVPNFLIIGAGRSGTTGLAEGLKTHPSVFITEPKEPHYFALHGSTVSFRGPGDAATINRVAVTDQGRYLALYPSGSRYLCLGDGSVSTLFYYDKSIPAILAMNPEMRLVVILREPVDRAYSAYQYMRARGFEPEPNFLDAIAQEPQRTRQGWHHLWHYMAMSRYADALAAFLSRFDAEQVGVWFYDDLASDYEGTVSEVLRFIGAPPTVGEATGVPRVNVSGTHRLPAFQSLVWAATRHESLRRAVKRMTTFRMRETVRRVTLRHTDVDAGARAQLAPEFADDLIRLASILQAYKQPLWLSQWSER